MSVLADYDPTDFEGREERELDDAQREQAAAIERRKELVWLLSGPRGRRKVRRELAEAGFYSFSDHVGTVLDRHHGEMCFKEGVRTHAMQLIWPMLRAVAIGELPLESLKLLVTEGDET